MPIRLFGNSLSPELQDAAREARQDATRAVHQLVEDAFTVGTFVRVFQTDRPGGRHGVELSSATREKIAKAVGVRSDQLAVEAAVYGAHRGFGLLEVTAGSNRIFFQINCPAPK